MSNDENNFRDDKFEDALKNEIFKDENFLNDDLNEGKGFILCNDFGVNVEIEKVKLLEAPKSESDDEREARLLIKLVNKENELEKRERKRNSIICAISCIIISILMITGFGNKYNSHIDIYDIPNTSYKSNSYSFLGIEYVKRLILMDMVYTNKPYELINAYQCLNEIEASIGGKNNVYDLLIAFGESIYSSDFTVSYNECINLSRIFDSLINGFIDSNQLSFRQSKKVVNILNVAFMNSRNLGEF